MKRTDCVAALAGEVSGALVVTTAGGATRAWWALGDNRGQLQTRTLGLCSSVGLGLALALPRRTVVVLDGDGALLMNLHSLVTCAAQAPKNLLHICFDNRMYESSGGTPTLTAKGADLAAVARAAGVRRVRSVDSLEPFLEATREFVSDPDHTFIHVTVEPDGHTDLEQIQIDEVENKYRLARYIEATEGITVLARRRKSH